MVKRGVIRSYQDGGEVEEDNDQQPYQVAGLLEDAVGSVYNRLNPQQGPGYDEIVESQRPITEASPRTRNAYYEGTEMPPDPRAQGWRSPPAPVPQRGGILATQAAPAGAAPEEASGPTMSDRLHSLMSPAFGTRQRPRMQGYDDGGYVDDEDEGLEGQGADDAMIDPMQFIGGALDYGRRRYGINTGGEMGFDDGGVVPTEPDPEVTADGNPNAIDPRRAMEYLAGDGAVSPEIAQALEQKVDPQGQLSPTQRAMTAISVAPNDEARFGLLQHYRTKYNAYSGAAKAALQRGDMGEAARNATYAMNNVPDGNNTAFAPTPDGLAKITRPAFGRRGGAPQQQAFEDGGEVEDEDEEVLQRTQPEPSGEYTPPPADAPQEEYPEQEALARPAPMPVQTGDQPEIVNPQQLIQELDKGFDAKLEPQAAGKGQERGGGAEEPVVPVAAGSEQRFRPAPAAEPAPVTGTSTYGAYNPMQPPPPLKRPGPREVPLPLEPRVPLTAEQLKAAYGGVAGASEAQDIAAEPTSAAKPVAATKPAAAAGSALAAEAGTPVSDAVMRDVNARGVVPTGAAAAPAAARAAPAAAPQGEPTGFLPSRAQARRGGGGREGGGDVGFPTYKTYEPQQQRGVVPTTGAGPAYKPLDLKSPEVLKAAQALPEYQAIPARGTPAGGRSTGVPGTVREVEQAQQSLRNRIPQTQWGNITGEQVQNEAERIRDVRRQQILTTVRDQLEMSRPGRENIPSAQEAALARHEAARRIPNNFGNSTGTLNIQTRPGSTAQDFVGRPIVEDDTPRGKHFNQLKREAAARSGWVGADAEDREKYIAQGMKDYDAEQKAMGVERLRGDKARETALATTDRAHDLETLRQQGRESLEDKKAAGRKELETFKQRSKAILQGSSIESQTLNNFARNSPELIGNVMKMKSLLGGHLSKLGIRSDAQIEALSEAMFEKIGAGGGGTGGGGARGAENPTAIDQAAARKMNPGDTAELRDASNGLVYTWTMTDRGTMLRDDKSGRKP